MGAEASTAKKPTTANLTIDQVQKAYERLEKRTNGKNWLNEHLFKETYSELEPVTASLYGTLEQDGRCSFSDLLLMADSLLGDAESQSAWLLRMFGTSAKALDRVVAVYARRHELNASESAMLLDYLMVDKPHDDSHFGRWLMSHSVARQLILHVFSPLIFEEGLSLYPTMSCSSSLLSHSAILAINLHLPSDRREDWTLLFSSALHGSSFAQIIKNVNGEGPCLVVIASSNGKTFGCFASGGFIMGPNYQGDATSFLFETKPHLRIYSATGRTKHYAYLNCQQVSLPNGLGIGGSESVWPLFIHEDYGKGISLANIGSFEKCHLAGDDQFDISSVEIWRVGEKPHFGFGEDPKRGEKSIIDKDPGAVALLEMSGRPMHSEAYREPAPVLDEPFDI